MILERVEITVRDGLEPEFEAAFCDVRQRVFMSPGFRSVTVAQGLADPSSYLVQILWETAEEHADFVASGRFARSWAPVDPFLARPLVVGLFAQRDALGFQGPGVISDLSWMS